MSKELTPLECVEYIRKQAYGNWLDDELDIIETTLKEKEHNSEMFKELKELIIDLLVYLDTQLNLNENTIPNSEYNNAIGIVAHLNEKHKDFGNAETRHALLCRIIDNFGVL